MAERRGLDGHLRLVAAPDHAGRTHLREQSFAAPFHLSKPFTENGVLVVNVVNPTAGLLRSDVARTEIRVETGAQLLLTTPSAMRVFNTQGGWSTTEQKIQVGSGAWLEILPELFIPHRGARHRQRTRIDVEQGGELCFLETLAPGRVASGEIFAFDELDWRTEVYHAGQRVVRERFVLSSRNQSTRGLRAFSTHPYVATFFLIADRLETNADGWQQIDSLQASGLWVGISRLVSGGWAVRIVAESSLRLREAVASVRRQVHATCGWEFPSARKL